jgi:hypothetical protein
VLQLAKKELAMAAALAMKRFPEGSELEPARSAAEKEYAEAMQVIGTKTSDAAVLAMAAEAFMNLSPWDYYQVRLPEQELARTKHVIHVHHDSKSAIMVSP